MVWLLVFISKVMTDKIKLLIITTFNFVKETIRVIPHSVSVLVLLCALYPRLECWHYSAINQLLHLNSRSCEWFLLFLWPQALSSILRIFRESSLPSSFYTAFGRTQIFPRLQPIVKWVGALVSSYWVLSVASRPEWVIKKRRGI